MAQMMPRKTISRSSGMLGSARAPYDRSKNKIVLAGKMKKLSTVVIITDYQ